MHGTAYITNPLCLRIMFIIYASLTTSIIWHPNKQSFQLETHLKIHSLVGTLRYCLITMSCNVCCLTATIKNIVSFLWLPLNYMISREPKREIIYSQRWICYRCHLTFETNSIANLHTQLSGHPIYNLRDKS